jgi:hypothetical protein
MKALQAKNSLVEKIPIEGLKMSDIKNDPVTLGDRPLVERIRSDHRKQIVGAAPGSGHLFDQIVADNGIATGGKHLISQLA